MPDAIERFAATPGYAANVVRPASRGDFRWRFAFTPDGERIAGGVLPHLIQWDVAAHPAERLPDSGVRLSSLLLGRLTPTRLRDMLGLLRFDDGFVHVGQSAIAASGGDADHAERHRDPGLTDRADPGCIGVSSLRQRPALCFAPLWCRNPRMKSLLFGLLLCGVFAVPVAQAQQLNILCSTEADWCEQGR